MEQSLALSRQFDRIMGLVRIGSIAQRNGEGGGEGGSKWLRPLALTHFSDSATLSTQKSSTASTKTTDETRDDLLL